MATRKIKSLILLAMKQRKVYLPFLILMLLFSLQIIVPRIWPFELNGPSKTEKIQERLNKFFIYFENEHINFNKLTFEKIPNAKLKKFSREFFQIQNYKKDTNNAFSLVFWSKNALNLSQEEIDKSIENPFVKDDQWIVFSKQVDETNIVSSIVKISELVESEWHINTYLFEKDNKFANYSIQTAPNKYKNYEIKSNDDFYLFSIVKNDIRGDVDILFSIFLFIIEGILLFYFLKNFFKILSIRFPLTSVFIIFIILFGLRQLMITFKTPDFLYRLKIFNSSIYSGSKLNPTLGDFLIFILITLFLIQFIYNRVFFNTEFIKKYKIGFLVHTLVIIFFLGEVISIVKIFERIVLESSIWFNFNYFPRITIYSVLGLTILLLSFSSYFLLAKKGMKEISKIPMSNLKRFNSFALVLIITLLFFKQLHLAPHFIIVFFIIYLSVLTLYIRIFVKNQNKIVNTFFFILFASTITTFLLNHFNAKKETAVMESFASEIAFGRDLETENALLKHLKCNIELKILCKDSLENKHIKIDTIYKSKTTDWLKMLTNAKPILGDPNFQVFLVTNPNNKFYLIDNCTSDILYKISPINYLNKLNYSVKNNINEEIIGENSINYSIYKSDTLVEFTGTYPFNYTFNYTLNQRNEIIETPETENFINKVYNFGNNIKVVLNTYSIQPISTFALFSYIFCFNLILFSFYFIVVFILRLFYFNKKQLQIRVTISLRNKITAMIIGLIFSIFLSIAVISYSNLKSKTEEYKKEYLLNKLNSIQNSLNFYIKDLNEKTTSEEERKHEIKQYLDKLALNNNIEIGLYTLDGKEYLQSKMLRIKEPFVRAEIMKSIFDKKTKLLTKIKIDSKNNLYEAFSLVFPNSKNNNFIIILPLKDNVSWMKSDVSNFIVSLVNIYVFLFLLAIIVAYWLSYTITEPLKMLISKISKIRLSSKNEIIEYDNRDEIGQLVRQYNKLVKSLDLSVKQLAFTEREQAWREMAKQIAHEIKNPLTPMKLRIQYLQRKIKDGEEDLSELTLNVCNTLIEQIDNLSGIASAFSNFAKLKDSVLEVTDLIPLIQNITNLFDDIENTVVSFQTNLETAPANIDREQMISCLNNIIKNGIQSSQMSHKEKAQIDIALIQVNKKFKILIKDNGNGVPEELIEKIFEPNFTTKSSGTGLGLAITKKFIEQMHGEIELKSKFGEGALFTIILKKHG
jgi:nitrogen fixation/metabolism regulation signal transduction histidine kinase